MISERKSEPQWLLDFRLDAFRKWQKMEMPEWGHLDMPHIDYQDIIYYAAPKKDADRPKEIDPKLAETFEQTRNSFERTRNPGGCGSRGCCIRLSISGYDIP